MSLLQYAICAEWNVYFVALHFVAVHFVALHAVESAQMIEETGGYFQMQYRGGAN